MKKSARANYSSYVPYILMLSVGIAIGVIAIKGTEFKTQAKVSELGGLATLDTSTVVIPDNSVAGKRATHKLAPTTSFVIVDCQDPDSCDITLDDSVGKAGDMLYIYHKTSTIPVVNSSRMGVFTSLYSNEASNNFGKGATTHFIHNGLFWGPIES